MFTLSYHNLFQITLLYRMASTKEENAYLISRLSKLIAKCLVQFEMDGPKFDHYAYLAPVMRALLEKSK